MNADVKITAEKLRSKRKKYRIAKIILAILILLLIIIYLVTNILYNGYGFTISLDKNMYYENNIIIYDNSNYKTYRQKIEVESLDFFDNISSKWLPDDLDDYEGSHNGENYVAYSFYIENMGEDIVDYWSEIIIEDVIKNVDEAIRMRVYFDGIATTYAHLASNGQPEIGTTPFESESVVMSQHIENFGPGQKHKYTIVMWLEGTDVECNNNIIGGEFKASMTFNSEFKD